MAMVSRVPFQLTGRYAERSKWEVINGPGDSRPTGLQVVEDEGLVGAMRDKVVLVTGVSSGIGPETVRAMAATGATVFATARNLDKARAALGPSLLGTGRVRLLFVDQTDLSSVRACAAEFRRQSGGKLHVLINNAGVMKTPEGRTKDGFELQFGTNHLSHFLLFYLLRDLLLASATPDFHSRVVNVSSSGHRYGPVRFDDLDFEGVGEYNGWAAYGQSKTANIYMANQIERLYGARRLHGYSLDPGSFESPNLQKHCAEEMAAARRDARVAAYFVSLQQGCATSVYAAVSREIEGRGRLYLEGAAVAGPVPADGDVIEYGYGAWAFDPEKEERLWAVSKEMVGVE
ncbi:short-chain dehydrogenase [Hypoxylon cercidicola]|nr:short-chain dehydrogenase [Hypoxylon cercidicola]